MDVKMKKTLLLQLLVGVIIVASVWWLVKCQCINLGAFTPSSLRGYIQSFGRFAAIIYIIAYCLNTVSIFPPIAPLSLTAGVAFGAIWGAVYLMIGAIIGTTATFMISRFFGRGLAERMLKGRFRNLDEKLERNGFMTILFFRVIPIVPYEVLNYASGLSKIKFKDYFFATILGIIPGVVISAFFGGSLGEIRGIKDIFAPKFLIAVGLMAMVIAIPAIYQILKNKRKKRRV